MKKIVLIPFALVAALTIALLLPIKCPVTENQPFGKEKILIEYEIFGCGSLVTRVVGGGEELADSLGQPDTAADEVVFTKDSDEPIKHLDTAGFFTAGLARDVRYVVYGKAVGVTKGAPDCCEPGRPAYHDSVPLFQVTDWAPTQWMPYLFYGDGSYVMAICVLLAINGVLLIVSVVTMLIFKLHERYHKKMK